MAKDDRDVLEMLKFELQFLEYGGYGSSPRTPSRPPLIFRDSPTCLNFDDPSRPNPCTDCLLMQLVPPEHRSETHPCHFIHLNKRGETVDSFYRWGTQLQLEDALRRWLREAIKKLEDRQGGPESLISAESPLDPLSATK